MSYWFVDRTLPGIVGALIVAAAVSLSHILLRRYFRGLTGEQTAHFDQATAQQTAELKGGSDERGSGDA